MANSFPKQGDIIFIDVEPHLGHEYGDHSVEDGNIRRPMIVLSNNGYNEHTKMLVGMVITSTDRYLDPMLHKDFMDVDSGVHGKIFMCQIPSYDYVPHHVEVKENITDKLLEELKQRAKDIFN